VTAERAALVVLLRQTENQPRPLTGQLKACSALLSQVVRVRRAVPCRQPMAEVVVVARADLPARAMTTLLRGSPLDPVASVVHRAQVRRQAREGRATAQRARRVRLARAGVAEEAAAREAEAAEERGLLRAARVPLAQRDQPGSLLFNGVNR
jgi:hypothetical protein